MVPVFLKVVILDWAKTLSILSSSTEIFKSESIFAFFVQSNLIAGKGE